jgi:hypothetical protein
VAAAERLVFILKIYLLKCHLFKRTQKKAKSTLDVLSLEYVLAKIQHLINSRPLFVHKNVAFSVNDIAVASQQSDRHIGRSGLSSSYYRGSQGKATNEAELFHQKLQDMQETVNELMVSLAENLAPLLLQSVPYQKVNQHGYGSQYLAINDIVLDKRQLVRTGCLTGSLARLQMLSECNRFAIIVRIKQSLLHGEASRLSRAISRGATLKPKTYQGAYVSVGRDVQNLFLVAKYDAADSEACHVYNGGLKLFDFSDCLAKVGQKEYEPICLPPPGHCDLEQYKTTPAEEWIARLPDSLEEPGEAEKDPEDYPIDTDTDTDESAEEYDDTGELQPGETRTRSGRISRRPARP